MEADSTSTIASPPESEHDMILATKDSSPQFIITLIIAIIEPSWK